MSTSLLAVAVMLPQVNPAVLWQRLPDGGVLLDPATEVYYGLDPVGSRVWELLASGAESLDEVCSTIANEYPDAEPAAVQSDVSELLAQLESHGLIHARAADRD